MKKGISLIEVLVVLFLVACLAWGTLPNFMHHQKERELKLGCAVVEQTFSAARFQAIRDRRELEVVVSARGDALSIRDAARKDPVAREERLPEGIRIAQLTRNLSPIVFRPDGGLAGISGSVTVADQRTGQTRRIIIYNLTGRTRIVQ